MAQLRRDLGTLESYAALVGILVGAGIFRVTSDAFARTGPSVVLGYLALAPIVLATSVAYVVFLSTPLGREPGGEYAHISRTFGDRRLAFLGAWLKLISYVGAAAFLAVVLADYSLQLAALLGVEQGPAWRTPLALAGLVFFLAVHVLGVRWFGRLQVAMCAVLGVSVLVLIVPGLFAIRLEHYRPAFTGGGSGFAAALVPLFFAYAGFESLAQTAGEVEGSTRRLPRVFVRGILLTTLLFLSMSAVALGVVPGTQLVGERAPMAVAAGHYLPFGATALVTVGGILAVATSLNATLYVPGRLAMKLVDDGLLPGWLGAVHPRTRTPVAGLSVTVALAALLLVSGQMALALNIAVAALVLLYAVHDVALLALPRRNPALFAQVTARVPRGLQRAAGQFSLLSMLALLGVQLAEDLAHLRAVPFAARLREGSLTSLELGALWGIVGALIYTLRVRRAGASTRDGARREQES